MRRAELGSVAHPRETNDEKNLGEREISEPELFFERAAMRDDGGLAAAETFRISRVRCAHLAAHHDMGQICATRLNRDYRRVLSRFRFFEDVDLAGLRLDFAERALRREAFAREAGLRFLLRAIVRFFERAGFFRALARTFLVSRDFPTVFRAVFWTVFFISGRIGRPVAAARPTKAPIAPPTTAPIGPATLPTSAPAAKPAVCFEMGGISMFSDDCGVSFFCASDSSGIMAKLLRFS